MRRALRSWWSKRMRRSRRSPRRRGRQRPKRRRNSRRDPTLAAKTRASQEWGGRGTVWHPRSNDDWRNENGPGFERAPGCSAFGAGGRFSLAAALKRTNLALAKQVGARGRASAACNALSCSIRMANEAIPNLTAFDDAALDTAFGALEAQAREDAAALDAEALRLKWLGRKQGLLNEISDRWLKAAPGPAKKAVGQRFKVLKELVESLLE